MTRRLPVTLLAALAALAGCTSKAPPPPAEAAPKAAAALAAIVATCASAVGDVQVRRAGQAAWEKAAPGSVFRVGDEVRTGALSPVRIEFLAGGGLEMEESAAVVIDVAPPPRTPAGTAAAPAGGARAPAQETRVAVKEGVVRGFLPAGSEDAPAAGLLVRAADGSDLRIASRPGQTAATLRLTGGARGTEIAVLAGSAAVAGARGERVLAEGQAAMAGAGELGEAAELIDFPQSLEPGIDARFQFQAGLSVRLAWKAVEGATGYRLQVARDLSFQHVEAAREVAGTEASFQPPATGTFVWRVTSRDQAGRLGEYGFARRFHCEESAPRDFLLGPADGAVVRSADALPRVAFSWESSGGARAYRLVLASGPDLLERKLSAVAVQGQRWELPVAPGEYWWGVYVEGQGEPAPLFVKPRKLTVKKAAKAKVDAPRSISRWGD
jgi:hypothetical protein